MSSERETIEITTPIDKHKVILKAWLTGGESRKLRRVFLEGAKVKSMNPTVGAEFDMADINTANLIEQAEDLALQTVIISIDGERENIVEKVLEMKSQDSDFIIGKVNEVTEGRSFMMPE